MDVEEFKKLYPDCEGSEVTPEEFHKPFLKMSFWDILSKEYASHNNLTEEEAILLNKLSAPPECMHDPEFVIETISDWQCGACGFVAKKSIEALPGVFINEV